MNPVDAVERYLKDLAEIRSTGAGVPETSYYDALSHLLNETGRALKPRVRCVLQLQNRGAGNPDGGFFTENQFQRTQDAEPMLGQPPERGAIEVKPLKDDAWVKADGKQVTKYWAKYGLVLVTNYRDFVLVGKDPNGHGVKLETYRLADNESAFWVMTHHPRSAAHAHGLRFVEYLKRVMLHAAKLTTSQDVAWFLASYARDAKARVEDLKELPALAAVRSALEEALGLKFEGEKGEHFFRSTLVQTLFYGVFSSWVLWSKQHPLADSSARFDWRQAAWSLHVPMIRALFEQVAAPTKLKPLGLVEPLEWTAATLNRVDRVAFFATFDQGQAVQYFYEPFLEHFDPELRKALGVWYTPPEVVKYMVTRVDTVLREDLGLEDGLADPQVYVLDPCCGTGAYLVEVLRRISDTLKIKGGDALDAQDLKKAAMQRVFGFEILPAPFVVAHLQLGLLLQTLGAPLDSDAGERIGVFLTNAQTGWEGRNQPPINWPELDEERKGARSVKLDRPILVVLGNPPYNAFAGVSPEEEEGLVEVYKGIYTVPRTPRLPKHWKLGRAPKAAKPSSKLPVAQTRYRLNDPIALGGWGIKKFNLDDLYVRFFRLAERRIVEKTGKGVVCFISNFSYLSDPSFVIMRERFLEEFDGLWFDCMNGDSRETGKQTPEGKPDPSVFSTEYHSVGIRVGTVVGLMVRKAARGEKPSIRYRDFWGGTKRADLLESLKAPKFGVNYKSPNPTKDNRFSFRPDMVSDEYRRWPRVVELREEAPISGLQEMRHGALMDIDRSALEERIRKYFDSAIDWEALKTLGSGLTKKAGGFDPKKCRTKLQKTEAFDPDRICRYSLYPFDTRWCYHTNVAPLWNRPRPTLTAQRWPGNTFFVTRMMAERPHEQIAMTVTQALPDYHLLRPNGVAIPIFLRPAAAMKGTLFAEHMDSFKTLANLSPDVRRYLKELGVKDPDLDADAAALVWMHALAIGYSPAYLAENADGIRQDWPRVPLPNSKQLLKASAELGHQLARLLDTEKSVPGVTSGKIRDELKVVGVIAKAGGGSINPVAGELDVSAGWGHAGKDGVIMPGAGRLIARAFEAEERTAIEEGASGLNLAHPLEHLGKTTYDVYLNSTCYWRNIPSATWDYTIGGYQVIKKWLSYRERSLLGRGLSMDEAREVTNIARRITAILFMQQAIDESYQTIKGSAFDWKSQQTPTSAILESSGSSATAKKK